MCGGAAVPTRIDDASLSDSFGGLLKGAATRKFCRLRHLRALDEIRL